MSPERDELRRRLADPAPGTPIVLLVDDDPATALLFEAAITTGSRHVWGAGSIRAAEEILAGHDVSLVILDLLLPDGDGRKLLERLRADRRTAGVPVFVMTSKLSPLVEEECYRLGADAFFEKPVPPAVLAAAVESRMRRTVAAAADSSPAAAGGDPSGASVLIVEDDPLTAELLKHRLAREGYGVEHTDDGARALEIARASRHDLVILDLKLPGSDGFDVLTALRALPGWRDTPVLVLTSMGAEQNLQRAFSLGASDYVAKPFSPAEVLARVRRLLARSR